MNKYLDAQREANAQAAFEAHLFNEDEHPEESDGWERTSPGNTWSRGAYFPNTEEEDGPTVQGHYTVEFEPGSSVIKSSYASINGHDVGEVVPVRAFAVDQDAPALKADYERSSHQDVESILDGLQEIWSTEQDNDAVVWSLTAAGQYLRQTGVELDRFYVVPRVEAVEYLKDMVEPYVLEGLRVAGALDIGYQYLTDRDGKTWDHVSEADAQAAERLRQFHPKNGTGFIAKDADGTYGIVLEGSEYPYEDTKDAAPTENWYEGRVVNGEPLPLNGFPTFEEITRHVQVEVDRIKSAYPELTSGIFHGDHTFDGHVSHLAFVPETHRYIEKTTEIGDAMVELWGENMKPSASPTP